MNITKNAPQTPADLLRDLEKLVSEAESMVTDSAVEHSSEAIEALRARFVEAQEQLANLYAGARKKVIAGAKCTDDAIRTHPYQSLAIALGVGVLVGVLVGRRTK